MLLGKTPGEIRALPFSDVTDLLALKSIHADEYDEAARKQDRASGRHKHTRKR